MPVYLKDNHSCLFIHIPKCGGSTFGDMAQKAGWREFFKVAGVNAKALGMFKSTPQHFHGSLLAEVFDIERFDVVLSIVRQPFDRLKSEYYWQLRQGMTKSAPAQWWEDVTSAYASDHFAFDNHIRPQHEFLLKSDKLEFFRIEDNGISNAFARLPGVSKLARASHKLKTVSVREKHSRYDEAIESAFADLRLDIEAFYQTDMERFSY